jgi:hypothetical protein
MHYSLTLWHVVLLVVLAIVLFGPVARYWPRDR